MQIKWFVPFTILVFHNFAIADQLIQLKSFVEKIDQIAEHSIELANQPLDSGTCFDKLTSYQAELEKIDPAQVQLSSSKVEVNATIAKLWTARLALRENFHQMFLKGQTSSTTPEQLRKCSNAVRSFFRIHRYIEDYLIELAYKPKRFDEKTDVKNVKPLTAEAPELLLANGQTNWTVRSGDIMISRGARITSAAIARISSPDSQFSHLAFVYVKGPDSEKTFTVAQALVNPNVLVLEAHIELGSTIRTFAEYVADANSRTALFRYKDFAVARAAAEASYQHAINYRLQDFKAHPEFPLDDPNHNIPYDFAMDSATSEKLFCSEVAQYGFKQLGVQIPMFQSEVGHNNDLIRRMGIKSNYIFAPGDIELDTRFEYLAEFRDMRKLFNIRIKDAVLVAVYDWMENKNYVMQPSLKQSAKAIFAWITRHLDFKFTKQQLPKNMSLEVLNTVFVLDVIGADLETYLNAEENKYYLKTQRLMSLPMMVQALEQYRAADEYDYNEYGYSKFHRYLHRKQ